MAARTPSAAVRKFRRERLIGRYLVNPAVGLLDRLGVRSPLIAELETVGARSGRPRRVPVTASIDETGAWLISQHGYRSGWARNIAADPHVRLRQGSHWRTGTAAFVPEDDVVARSRTFAEGRVKAAVAERTMKALESDPISVRITFAGA
ncbi:nitroreductase family deazaflavin-dependent oxidoreductase [Nocardia sp. NPDC005745]|uniref:nitroreductase family deazaflavin-dependent oxidoreductase n=1 Tax=Nocardia sp. NPDC005745 TaxID=3157061 RepID=UPI0033CD0066